MLANDEGTGDEPEDKKRKHADGVSEYCGTRIKNLHEHQCWWWCIWIRESVDVYESMNWWCDGVMNSVGRRRKMWAKKKSKCLGSFDGLEGARRCSCVHLVGSYEAGWEWSKEERVKRLKSVGKIQEAWMFHAWNIVLLYSNSVSHYLLLSLNLRRGCDMWKTRALKILSSNRRKSFTQHKI